MEVFEGAGRWLLGFVLAVVSLVALFLASRAHGDPMYYAGLVVFVICVLAIWVIIKQAYDHAESGGQGD
jgi:predicted membrane channel-forming protein YqfA (hemolysin III family)